MLTILQFVNKLREGSTIENAYLTARNVLVRILGTTKRVMLMGTDMGC